MTIQVGTGMHDDVIASIRRPVHGSAASMRCMRLIPNLCSTTWVHKEHASELPGAARAVPAVADAAACAQAREQGLHVAGPGVFHWRMACVAPFQCLWILSTRNEGTFVTAAAGICWAVTADCAHHTSHALDTIDPCCMTDSAMLHHCYVELVLRLARGAGLASCPWSWLAMARSCSGVTSASRV